MNPLQAMVLVVLTAVAVWFACQAPAAFVIRIEKGVAHLTRGKVTPAFLGEVSEVCGRVASGTVRGVRRGKRVFLTFSGDIPGQCQQRLRNVWVLHG
jgi:hypothetical protein